MNAKRMKNPASSIKEISCELNTVRPP